VIAYFARKLITTQSRTLSSQDEGLPGSGDTPGSLFTEKYVFFSHTREFFPQSAGKSVEIEKGRDYNTYCLVTL